MIRRAFALLLAGVCLPFAACSSDTQQAAAPHPTNAAPATPIPVSNPNPPSENDPMRTQWRIEVEPYEIFGSGHPGKSDTDFDKPDGVAFTPNGFLLATDARNRRVQVWDVKTKQRLGDFGHRTFGGEIVDIAVSPNGNVFVTDQKLNVTYAFRPPKLGEVDEETGTPIPTWDYQFIGTKFGEQGFDKLGGIAVDSKNRIYCVDAHLNDVRRYGPDFKIDPTWKFERTRADGDTYLHGCEGVAIDEASGELFVASEKDTVIQVFDENTGKYKGRIVGARNDGTGKATGKKVFFGSVEGLALAGHYLFAVDEGAGHMHVFDISKENVFNTDLLTYGASSVDRSGGYLGFFGHAPKVDFENKDPQLQKQVKDGQITPGELNPPGYFCSPDSISAYLDPETGETYIAIADQCNYRLAIYKMSDILKSAGTPSSQQAQAPPPPAPTPETHPIANLLPSTQPAHPAPPKARPAPRRTPPPPPPPPREDEKKKKKKKKDKF
jgi:DNA-binding beta-propeller fold protein YncE